MSTDANLDPILDTAPGSAISNTSKCGLAGGLVGDAGKGPPGQRPVREHVHVPLDNVARSEGHGAVAASPSGTPTGRTTTGHWRLGFDRDACAIVGPRRDVAKERVSVERSKSEEGQEVEEHVAKTLPCPPAARV